MLVALLEPVGESLLGGGEQVQASWRTPLRLASVRARSSIQERAQGCVRALGAGLLENFHLTSTTFPGGAACASLSVDRPGCSKPVLTQSRAPNQCPM